MARKPQKPREQRIAEDFFPVEPKDIVYSVEKKHSPLDVELPSKKEKPITLRIPRKPASKRPKIAKIDDSDKKIVSTIKKPSKATKRG